MGVDRCRFWERYRINSDLVDMSVYIWRVILLKSSSISISRFPVIFAGLCLLLVACAPGIDSSDPAGSGEPVGEAYQAVSSTGERYADFDIITVLPRDAIQAIDNPQFVSAEEAGEQYDDSELILGVELNGDARAYSIPLLSSHEIVNDNVGGVKIA